LRRKKTIRRGVTPAGQVGQGRNSLRKKSYVGSDRRRLQLRRLNTLLEKGLTVKRELMPIEAADMRREGGLRSERPNTRLPRAADSVLKNRRNQPSGGE